MSHSIPDFKYYLLYDVLVIEDLNKGNISLTNGVEVALKIIEGETKVPFVGRDIIYQDSEGMWDAMDWNGEEVTFLFLQCETQKEVLIEFFKLNKQS